MYRFLALPIRIQLWLIATIVGLPAAGMIIYTGLDQRKDAISDARLESQKLAENIASEQQALVASAKQLLSVLAQLPEIKSQNKVKAQPVLTAILSTSPQFLNIFIADSLGLMWASAKPTKAPLSVSDRRHFINAQISGQFSAGEFIIGRLLGKPTLSFAYPYQNPKGDFAGVIVVNIDLEYSRRILQRSKLIPGSSYSLVDHAGVILDTGINPAAYVGKRVKPEIFSRMQGQPDIDSSVGPGLDGVVRFLSCRKLRLDSQQAPYLYIRSGVPVQMSVEKANRVLVVNLVILSSFMVFGFILAWLIAKRSIVDRITALQAASQHLAAGDLQTRVSHLVEGGELGELGRVFDAMAVKLSSEIAECKRAEAAQRCSERFLRAIIDAEPEGVALIAPGGNLTLINRAGLAMIGADSLDVILGESIYPLVVPEYRDAFISLSEGAFRGREGTLEYELVGLTGRRLWLDTHAVPFPDEGGIVSLIAVTRDITERKLAELDIAALHRELAGRACELENANRELEAFNYTISHDLCKPLTLISGYCQAIQELPIASLDARCRDYLQEIYESTMAMGGLINTLLEFSRQSRQELHLQRVDLSELAQVVAAELTLAEMGRRVSFRIAEGMAADGDGKLLRVVIENLLGNAWKFTGKQDDAVIEFHRITVDGEEVFCVRDNGSGFDPSHADKLFVPFQRLPGSEDFKGYGIGLATAERIIQRHAGRIWAEGEQGVGATFYFTLGGSKG